MALMTRMARLLRADLHAVLDRIEEPEALLRQSLREMDECVNAERGELAALGARRDALALRRRDLEAALAAVAEQLDVCFEAGDDALARTLLRRRLESERLLAASARHGEALAAEHAALAQRVARREARLGELRRSAQVLCEQRPRHDDDAPHAGRADAVSDHDVEIALLREKRRRSAP